MRFSNEIVERFAAASRDFNPLHMSEVFARTTPFGQRVAHGACGVLASCGLFTPPAGCFPSALRVTFYQPPFFDIEYEPRVDFDFPQRTVVTLMDGNTEMMQITFEFLAGEPLLAALPDDPAAPLSTARSLSEPDLAPGLATEGAYSPFRSSYETLLRQFGVNRQAWGDALPVALMASSYLTGMEIPGERAMYFRLDAEFGKVPFALPTVFRQEFTGYDRRWGMVKSRFHLSAGDSAWCSGELQASLLPPRAGIAPVAGAVPPEMAARFVDKIALVVGGSRGFGSSLALTLAAAGSTVIVLYARSSEDARRLQAMAADLPGRILTRQCDATDLAACREVRQEILARHGRLDWLLCSGVPPLQTLRIEAAACERIEAYLRDGFALTLAPLACFLDLLSDSGGSVLLVSSTAVEEPPSIWPHYVALKCAVEGLAQVAAAEYSKVSFCIARPAKLLTDLLNTPMGRKNAENPSVAALRILSGAAANARPGKICIIK